MNWLMIGVATVITLINVAITTWSFLATKKRHKHVLEIEEVAELRYQKAQRTGRHTLPQNPEGAHATIHKAKMKRRRRNAPQG